MPAEFPVEPILRMLPPERCRRRRQLYVLEQPFIYDSPAFGRIGVPSGFETDFASIPPALESYLGAEDPVIAWPAIVHDWLYACQGRIGTRPALSRAECDAVLREAMILCGARRTQAAVVYRMVRLFGGSHWNN